LIVDWKWRIVLETIKRERLGIIYLIVDGIKMTSLYLEFRPKWNSNSSRVSAKVEF